MKTKIRTFTVPKGVIDLSEILKKHGFLLNIEKSSSDGDLYFNSNSRYNIIISMENKNEDNK